MCGWIAVIGRHGQAIEPGRLSDAMVSIAHRGPDDCGQFREGAVALGFVRLAIIDLGPGGHQPMVSGDGRHVIVFNGEIYNYRELRTELQVAGHRFASDSDTEVLLAAYRHWGEACLARLNGMFAFMILDRRDGSLFGARDRLGEKPMYRWQDENWTVFASEPRAIAAAGLTALRPDWTRLADFVVAGDMDHGGGTCLADVQQVPAANAVEVAPEGAARCHPYWAPPESADVADRRPDADWVAELSALASDAVRLRLRSDVPVGFTLSGGIDSSLLICEAAYQGVRELDAFTYQDRQYDERCLVEATIARTGARAHVVDADAMDVAALLPRVLAASGEPLHSLSPLANYSLFERARAQGVKVILGGQGADEGFGGYRPFERDRWHSMALDGAWPALVSDVRASARLHGAAAGPLLRGVARRALRYALARTRPYAWLRAARQAVLPTVGASPRFAPFSPDFWSRHSGDPGVWSDGRHLIDFQRRALMSGPLPLYLRIEDRVSMAHSVEARLPFTDVRLVEHALRMPDRLKFAGGLNKVALRAVAARRVPAPVSASVLKLGFPVGESERKAMGLQRLCRELAATRAFRERGIYDLKVVDALLARPPAPSDVDPLFHMAQMELWLSGLAKGPAPG